MIFLSANKLRWVEKYIIRLPQYFLDSLIPLWERFFGLAAKQIATTTTKSSLKAGLYFWHLQWEEVGRAVLGNIIALKQVTAQGTGWGSKLHQGNGTGSYPCSEEASSSCSQYFPVWVTFALSPLSLLTTNVLLFCNASCSLPAPFNLFPVLQLPQKFSSFSASSSSSKYLLALSVKGLSKSNVCVS